MTNKIAALTLGLMLVSGCTPESTSDEQSTTSVEFPRADRLVSEIGDTQFSTEAARDEAGESEFVMDWAGIQLGTTVADIGAGEGYYTIRLAERVGPRGRVLAQDINRGALDRLGERVTREQLDNVAIKEGAVDDPRLPENSFDRIFMVHMYHEIEEPYAFLWRMRPALAKGGQVIVVDRDRPTDRHGIPPKLLFCEFDAVGYRLTGFTEQLKLGGYIARFEVSGARPDPSAIRTCASRYPQS
ncbi:class I SAM-dependent methyltransferase [Sphingorhabdus sp.]|uniref:class I SAM-dependent methyltransferase n=1 Tax=Sphingorhabdus sp. TaxID=1902408 RepID=UPI00391AFE31